MDKLNRYEQDILDSFERGEWQSIENLQDEIKRYRKYAHTTTNKDENKDLPKNYKES